MQQSLRSTCLGLLVAVAPFAYAEDAPLVSLDAVTVYATRSPQEAFGVPAMTSKIFADAPGYALSSDVADFFTFTPGVETGNGPRRTGQTLSVRGFDDDQVVILIDGRRQHFESAHDGRFYAEPVLLKSVEVVKGSASSIYGCDRL